MGITLIITTIIVERHISQNGLFKHLGYPNIHEYSRVLWQINVLLYKNYYISYQTVQPPPAMFGTQLCMLTFELKKQSKATTVNLPANKGHTCPVPRQSCGVRLRQVPHQTRPHEVVVETHIDHTYKEGNHVTKQSYFQKSITCRFREVQNELFMSI